MLVYMYLYELLCDHKYTAVFLSSALVYVCRLTLAFMGTDSHDSCLCVCVCLAGMWVAASEPTFNSYRKHFHKAEKGDRRRETRARKKGEKEKREGEKMVSIGESDENEGDP